MFGGCKQFESRATNDVMGFFSFQINTDSLVVIIYVCLILPKKKIIWERKGNFKPVSHQLKKNFHNT